MSDPEDIVKEFLLESYENLDRLDRDLVLLEKNPTESSLLSSIFRTIHTIKGTCGFLGFSKLEAVSHVGENLLSRLRDGQIILDAAITSGLLALVDAVRQILASIEATGKEGDRDFSELIELLTLLKDVASEAQSVEPIVVEPDHILSPAISPQVVANTPIAVHVANPALPAPAPATVEKEAPMASTDATIKPSVSDSAIRVDVGLLDRLMNLVGELVLARNQILQFTSGQSDTGLVNASQRLNLITTELQEGVMKTRMQPIGTIWSKFPRVVRDLSNACGKRIRIEMDGAETELDKTIIEAIKDPLTHVIRNSVDHGIEPTEQRVHAGKPEEGCLRMRAFHEGGQVNIEISDDGGGINCDRVKKKALEKNLITPEQAQRMGEREATNLIFLPGFSTAEKITNVSGRGVGMDVVKTNIERIGGTVDVQTVQGQGTTLKIKIPLTLAIIPALVVTCASDRFAIPQVNLLELVRLDGEKELRGIELIHGSPVYRLRGELLPLVYIDEALGMTGITSRNAIKRKEVDAVNIVVLQADGRQFGLIVDQINDTEEIVVKPLSKLLKSINVYAGATIMGDGRVALILDVMGIAQKANVVAGHQERANENDGDTAPVTSDARQTMLVFGLGHNRRGAIPMAQVARLEEFRPEQVERAGEQEVIQYRGQIMPLIPMTDLLSAGRHSGSAVERWNGLLQVVVHNVDGRSYGLVVDQIIDIVHERIVLQTSSRRVGVLGTAVLQERVTELLDIEDVVRLVDAPSFQTRPAARTA